MTDATALAELRTETAKALCLRPVVDGRAAGGSAWVPKSRVTWAYTGRRTLGGAVLRITGPAALLQHLGLTIDEETT